MLIARLPTTVLPPLTGWMFHGPWPAGERAAVERTLRERIPNPTQAQADSWLFLAHDTAYYAHSPSIHTAGMGYCAASADDLAEALWDHYFSLRLGPLAWSPPPAAHDPPAPPAAAESVGEVSADPLLLHLEREWEALEHFETACGLLADGEYAAAKRELELSLTINPATSFYDHKRVETLGDTESCLGNDDAACQHYRHALTMALGWQESWTHTELRLKLVWCLLRLGCLDEAQHVAETAHTICQASASEEAGQRRGLTYVAALALATLADVHFHRNDSGAAVAVARQAAAMAGRLGQAYEQKVRLLTYLAWQLYRHDEATEARTLAQRAQAALDHWMPLDARYVRALRATLATILGVTAHERKSASRAMLPSLEVSVTQALAAARAMQNWIKQLEALHRLAPYLQPGQLTPPYDDIHLWADELLDEPDYQTLLSADLRHARAGAADTPRIAAQQLLDIDSGAFTDLGHSWLYAESLLALRGRSDVSMHARVERRLVACAAAWSRMLRTRIAPGDTVDLIQGLAVLLPHIPLPAQHEVARAVEGTLRAQLQPNHSCYADAFLAGLPALARCGTGQAVVELIVQEERQSIQIWGACLAHAAADDATLRDEIIETALRALPRLFAHGLATEGGELVCHMAPYLDAEQARRALALATSMRSITPRVRALVALARALPGDERALVFERAWQAAQRSRVADVRGEALAALVVSMAAPPFGYGPIRR